MKMSVVLDKRPAVAGQPAVVANELSEILIVKSFISSAECEALRQKLDAAEIEEELGIMEAPIRIGDPSIQSGDLMPNVLLEQMLARQPAFNLVLDSMPPDVLRRVAGLRSLSEIDAEMSLRILDVFNRLVEDPMLYNQALSLTGPTLPPRALLERTELTAEGVIYFDDAQMKLSRSLTADESARLKWFNVTLLEEKLFPGAVRKRNRLFGEAVEPNSLSEQFGEPIVVGTQRLPSLVALFSDSILGAQLASGDGLHVSAALAAILTDRLARSRLFAQYLQAVRLELSFGSASTLHQSLGVASAAFDTVADDANGERLAHLLLCYLFPQVVVRHEGGRIEKAYRNCQTVDWRDIAGAIKQHLIRFVHDVVEPYYERTVSSIAEIEILKYGTGGFQLVHNDSENAVHEGENVVWQRVADRDLSILVYLSRSSDYQGGALWFPEQCVQISPEEGMAIGFPSDHRFPHCVREIESGTRYAIVGWLQCTAQSPPSREANPIGGTPPVADQTFETLTI